LFRQVHAAGFFALGRGETATDVVALHQDEPVRIVFAFTELHFLARMRACFPAGDLR